LAPDTYCAKVVEVEIATYTDANCTEKAEPGKGKFIARSVIIDWVLFGF
jgi:hypothetical protein